jgi:flagellar biosynthesis protein FlhA
MDGASKFVRGDAIAGLLITGINMFGGIIIGYARHDMEIGEAADVFRAAFGRRRAGQPDPRVDRLPGRRPVWFRVAVSSARPMRPSLISWAAIRGPCLPPQACSVPSCFDAGSSIPYRLSCLAAGMAFASWIIPRQRDQKARAEAQELHRSEQEEKDKEKDSVKSILKTAEIELVLGKQVATKLLGSHEELAFRVAKMRKKFATQYGFVVPEIKVTDDICDQGQELPDPDPWHHRGRQRSQGGRTACRACRHSPSLDTG